MRKLVLILGAKSDNAKATAVNFAKNGFDLFLVGRDVKNELKEFCQMITGEFEQNVSFYDLDILDKDDQRDRGVFTRDVVAFRERRERTQSSREEFEIKSGRCIFDRGRDDSTKVEYCSNVLSGKR